jgi:hypothetical protein
MLCYPRQPPEAPALVLPRATGVAHGEFCEKVQIDPELADQAFGLTAGVQTVSSRPLAECAFVAIIITV